MLCDWLKMWRDEFLASPGSSAMPRKARLKRTRQTGEPKMFPFPSASPISYSEHDITGSVISLGQSGSAVLDVPSPLPVCPSPLKNPSLYHQPCAEHKSRTCCIQVKKMSSITAKGSTWWYFCALCKSLLYVSKCLMFSKCEVFVEARWRWMPACGSSKRPWIELHKRSLSFIEFS